MEAWVTFARWQLRASAATAAPIGLVASVGQEMATALLCRIRHNTRLPVSTILITVMLLCQTVSKRLWTIRGTGWTNCPLRRVTKMLALFWGAQPQRTVWAPEGTPEGTIFPPGSEYFPQSLRLSQSYSLTDVTLPLGAVSQYSAPKDSVRACHVPKDIVNAPIGLRGRCSLLE